MKQAKKIISLILSFVLSLSVLPIFASAKVGTTNDPIIYIGGDGTSLYKANGEEISKDVDTGEIAGMVKEVIFPYFVNCITKGTDEDWEAYYAKFAEVIGRIYKDFRPNDDGTITDGSGIGPREAENKRNSSLDPVYRGGYDYDNSKVNFFYDQREDPFITASKLKTFIDNFKKSTKHDKVQISTVCYGGEVVLTYLEEYGSDSISSIFLDTTVSQGTVVLTGLASGTIKLDGQSLQRFLNDQTFKQFQKENNSEMQTLFEFLKLTLEMLNQYGIVDILGGGLSPFINKLAKELLPRIYMATGYGTSLAHWATIDNAYFDKAIENTFGVADFKTRYATLIEKIKYYHEKVGSRYMEILGRAKENGVNIGVVAKYGWGVTPIFGTNDEIGDHVTLCKNASFGATCAKADKALSKDYVEKKTSQGLGKYISCDRMVDTSTCLVPDSTWILKGIEHDRYTCSNPIKRQFFNADGNFTVWDDPNYPPFLTYDPDTYEHDLETVQENPSLIPLTTENMNQTNWETGKKMDFTSPKSFVNTLTSWIVSLIKAVKLLFAKLQELIKSKLG